MQICFVLFLILMPFVLYANEMKDLSSPTRAIRSAKCVKESCTDFCESKLNNSEKGKKFMARCLQTQECQCLFPWRQTTDSMITWRQMD